MTITFTDAAENKLAPRSPGAAVASEVKNVGCCGFGHTFKDADDLRSRDRLFQGHDAKLWSIRTASR